MQFEGEHRPIALRGIEHSAADGVMQDGGMNEVINMIPRNGSYVPYAPNAVDNPYELDDTVKMVRIHHTSTGDNTIIVYEDSYKVGRNGEIVNEVDKVVNDIVFIGNRMDLETADGIEHLLWKNDQYINQDDLKIHENSESALPSVAFKVSRGIYDGKTVYPSARYVKVHKNFTDADTAKCSHDELVDYARSSGSVGSDAMALLDSIRHMGGITGHVLVAAAWRLKGSDVSNPHYLMASPILLMQAPEVKAKDGYYTESGTDYDSVAIPNTTFFLDMFDHATEHGDGNDETEADVNRQKLFEMTDSDDRDVEDLSEKEHVFIEPLDTNNLSVIRVISGPDDLRDVTAGTGEQAVWKTTSISARVYQPSLCARKFGIYDHGKKLGTSHGEAQYRGVRITHGTANVLQYRVDDGIADKYRDEIDCLCIFCSPIISPYKTNDSAGVRFVSDYKAEKTDRYDGFFFGSTRNDGLYGINATACGGSFTPLYKSDEEIRNEIINIAGLYKVREVQLNDLQPNTWLKVDLSGGVLATDRMIQHSDTMLKISDLQPVGFTSGHIFGYNERLHVFNIRKDETYRLPYKSLAYYQEPGQYSVQNQWQFIDSSDENLDPIEFKYSVEVKDSNDSTVVTTFTSDRRMLNPLVCCPDMDIKSIRIVKGYEWQGSYYIGEVNYSKDTQPTLLTVASVAGGVLNNNFMKPIYIETHEVVSDVTHTAKQIYDATFGQDDIKDSSRSFGKNELRVSMTASTLFEIDKSYKIGHGEIIALARLSMGLSQDNYSKFPLVVFCTDGIYTLSVDASGKYAYTNQDALSRVVCTNKNGICELDGAVLFPTEYGLQIATADGVKPVVLQANGRPKNQPHTDAGLSVYRKAINHPNIVQLLDDISYVDFLEYIQYEDTYIKYIHALNSVLIYNRVVSYSYLVEIGTWLVTKLEQRVSYDDGNYPKQSFYTMKSNSGDLIPVEFDYYSGEDSSQCLLVTRPLMLETTHMKTAYRVVLRGVFDDEAREQGEEKYAGLYVFGSLDAEHWDYLNGAEKKLSGNKFHDFGVETHHVSYRYLMVVFAGNLSKYSHIEGLEITSKPRYNNKLK